jgi:hypothetical protein
VTQLDDIQLGPVVLRLRGKLALTGYLAKFAVCALVAGVVGISRGDVLDGLYGLGVGVLAGSPTVLGWLQTVTVHQEGFVWRRRAGTRTRTVLHTEIKKLQPIRVYSWVHGNYEQLTVTLLNGEQLSIECRDTARLAQALAGAKPAPVSAWQPPEPAGRGDR